MGLLTTRAHADLQDPLGGQITVKIRELQRESFKIGAESWLNDLVKISTLPLHKFDEEPVGNVMAKRAPFYDRHPPWYPMVICL